MVWFGGPSRANTAHCPDYLFNSSIIGHSNKVISEKVQYLLKCQILKGSVLPYKEKLLFFIYFFNPFLVCIDGVCRGKNKKIVGGDL